MQKIGVVGCGLMGAGIAEVCARAGLEVVVAESTQTAAEVGRTRLEKSLIRAEERGRIDSAAQVLARIRVVHGLQLGLHGVVAFHVVEVLVALGLFQDELFLS